MLHLNWITQIRHLKWPVNTKSTCGASAFSVIYPVVGASSANCVIEIENRVDLWYNEASEKCAEAEEEAWSNRKFI